MRSSPGYPILLDVGQRRIVIIGGGPVAARKAGKLLAAGATRVRVVAPQFHDEMPAEVERVHEAYRETHLDGAEMVFAATHDVGVNTRVVRDARARGALVMRADENEEAAGDFTVPAVHRDGPLVIAVSAGSAALAAAVRDQIRDRLDPRWGSLAEAMRVLRPRIRNHPGLSPQRRHEVFRELAHHPAVLAAAEGGPEGVWKWLLSIHPDLVQQ